MLHREEDTLYVVLCSGRSDGRVGVSFSSLVLCDDTISGCIDTSTLDTAAYVESVGGKADAFLANSIAREVLDRRMWSAVLSRVLYLSAHNADVQPVPRKSRRKAGKSKSLPAKVWRVGERIGPVLARAREQTGHIQGERTGRKMPAHMKCGHFRHPWVGKRGEQTQRRVWIAPFPVNVDLDSSCPPPIVARPVR